MKEHGSTAGFTRWGENGARAWVIVLAAEQILLRHSCPQKSRNQTLQGVWEVSVCLYLTLAPSGPQSTGL